MKYGAPFIGSFSTLDPIAIRDYVQAVEELGYEYLFTDEVLLNDNPNEIFHESLTLFAYLAAATTTLKFVTGVMILPKRATLMVARQAAEVDVLSNGRLRLGVGVGWSECEFRALGIDFRSRGKRIVEQIMLLRALWTNPQVTFIGTFHHVEKIGINLLPVQRPIPIWMGGDADVVLRRAARIADGWMATLTPEDTFRRNLKKLHGFLGETGKNNQNFRVIRYLRYDKNGSTQWQNQLSEWQDLGITHTVLLPATEKEPDSSTMDHTLDSLRTFMTEYAL